MTILLVEDEKNLRESIEEFLKHEGYQIESVASYQKAIQKNPDQFDLIILDWGLPDGQGLDLLKEWRKKSKVKVLFLSARADIVDRILGLEFGAQDYLTKPFDPRELLARVRVQLREDKHLVEQIDLGELILDLPQREVRFKNKNIALTKMDFRPSSGPM